ncbi:MAG: hypothetical protein KJ737_17995 [Proteobacteria bacterium]|nr:hypothetical protein [Pseudomonadota bacterium]
MTMETVDLALKLTNPFKNQLDMVNAMSYYYSKTSMWTTTSILLRFVSGYLRRKRSPLNCVIVSIWEISLYK